MEAKNIIVTGATKGIGRAIVETLAAKGHHIAFCARTEADVNEFAAVLRSSYPEQKFIGKAVDVSDREAVIAFGKSIIEEFGRVDVLVNNAGIFLQGDLLSEEFHVLDYQLKTNVVSAYALSRVVAADMISRGEGDIINISSIAGISPYPNASSYCISKFAMRGFGLCLREELKDKGVRVTNILPGATWSNSWAGADIDPERIMPATDIANVVSMAIELDHRSVMEEIVLRPQLGDL